MAGVGPWAHPRSSNGPWLWWPSLGTQSLARFPGLETRVTPAPGGGQACEAPPSGRRVGCPRHWPSPRRPPGRTGLPAQCPHGALPAAPGLPSPGGGVAVAPVPPHSSLSSCLASGWPDTWPPSARSSGLRDIHMYHCSSFQALVASPSPTRASTRPSSLLCVLRLLPWLLTASPPQISPPDPGSGSG